MRGQAYLFPNFAGGVNRQAAPYDLKENEARDARNVVSTSRGAIRRRDGAQLLATPTAALHSLHALPDPAFLVGAGGATLQSITPGGVVDDITGALAITPGLRWEFVLAAASGGQGPLFGMNGTDTPIAWSGSGDAVAWTASSGTLPNGKFMVVTGNKIFVAGDPAHPSRLAWCDLNSPRVWPAANVVDFDPEDGEEISGLGVLGPYVVVFKASKAWRVYDLETGANVRIGENVGCVAHRSIVETPEGLIFLSKDQGVMVTSGQNVKRISDRVKLEIDGIAAGQRELAAAAFFDGHYYLSICQEGTDNDLTLDYDAYLDSWWLHDFAAADWAVWEAGAAVPALYAAHGAQAVVHKAFVPGVTSDAGTTYPAYWKGPYLPFGAPGVKKRIREALFDGSGRFDVYVGRDFQTAESYVKSIDFTGDQTTFGGSDSYGGDGTFGDPQPIAQANAPTLGTARAVSMMFRSDVAAPFEIESYTLAVTRRTD